MILHIIKNDLKLLIADKTLWVIIVLFVLLIGYSIFNGVRWAKERQKQTHELTVRGDRALKADRDDLSAIESGVKPMPSPVPQAVLPTGKSYPTVLPPASLSALSVGQSDIYPYTTTVDIYATKHAPFNFYEQDNPINLLAGRFDSAFVIVFLFPLLILALSYNVLSQEKESGTLQMTLGQSPLSLKTFVFGKIAARFALILILTIGLSTIGLLISKVSFFASATLPRFLLWISAITAYALFWFVLAVAVNALGKSSAANAVILAGIWIALVVVMPSLLNIAAASIHPVPSRLEFVSKLREADNYTRSEGQKLLAKYYSDHPELVPEGQLDLNDFTRRFYAVRQENQRCIFPETLRFEEQLAAQQSLINRYRILSPAVVMQESLNDIAGTSTARQKSYVEQIRNFIDQWQNFFVPLVMRKATLKAADYDQIPRFQFQEETNGMIAKRIFVGLLLLILPTSLLVFFAFAKLRRYTLVG